jgi:hypothetical protein
VNEDPAAPEIRVRGEIVDYRLYDVGYEIDLDRVAQIFGDQAPQRTRPLRVEAQAIQISNPPVTVAMGDETVTLGGGLCSVEMSARVFDFGVCSLRARVRSPGPLPWSEFLAWCAAAGHADAWSQLLAKARDSLQRRIAVAITKPGSSPVTEDYVVFRIDELCDSAGHPLQPDVLPAGDVAQLLLDEPRPPSESARRDLVSPAFTYFEHDLALLTWSSALVVEPVAADTDVQYVLEFANAQLLELRYYDALLDRELPSMYDRIAGARASFHLLGRRYSSLLGDLQTRVAEVTELVERSENAFKVTDDVFLARIYSAALEIFGARTWRRGIDRKLEIIRDTYTMLNAETQARRTEALEVVIVLLIVVEIVLALIRR